MTESALSFTFTLLKCKIDFLLEVRKTKAPGNDLDQRLLSL